MAHAKEACSHCLSCCFHCCSQIDDPQHPLQKGRFVLSHSLRVQALVGKTLQQMCLAAGHVILQSGSRERWRLTLCLHYPFFYLRPQPMGWYLPRCVFSHPLNHCENIFPHTLRGVIWLIPSPVHVMMRINHHNLKARRSGLAYAFKIHFILKFVCLFTK